MWWRGRGEGEDGDAAFHGCCKSCRRLIQSVKGKARCIPGGCRLEGAGMAAVSISRAQLGQGRMKRCFQASELNVPVCGSLIFNLGVNKRLPAKSGL